MSLERVMKKERKLIKARREAERKRKQRTIIGFRKDIPLPPDMTNLVEGGGASPKNGISVLPDMDGRMRKRRKFGEEP